MSNASKMTVKRVYPDDDGGTEGYLGLRLFNPATEEIEASTDIDLQCVDPVFDLWLPRGISATLGARLSSTATAAERFAGMVEQAEEWAGGKFKSDRVSSGPTVSVLAEAIASVRKISVAQAQIWLRPLSDEEKRHVEVQPGIAEAVAELREMRATTTELDDLLPTPA